MSSASELPEKKSGSGVYIIGALLLAAGIGAIVLFTGSDDKPPAPPPPPTAIQADNTPPAPAPPPPPPPPTASATASATAEPTGSAGPKGPPGPGACSNCGQGKSNSSLDGALRAAAGSARGCYNRALQKNAGAAGKLTVNVQVGPSGAVCGASISNDTVGSPEVSHCVLGRFQGKSFPKPDQGCVSVQIPMSFEVKQ